MRCLGSLRFVCESRASHQVQSLIDPGVHSCRKNGPKKRTYRRWVLAPGVPSQKPDSCFYRNLVHVSTETWFRFPQKPGSCFEKVVGAAPLCFCFWRAIFFSLGLLSNFQSIARGFALVNFPKIVAANIFPRSLLFGAFISGAFFPQGGQRTMGSESRKILHTHTRRRRACAEGASA